MRIRRPHPDKSYIVTDQNETEDLMRLSTKNENKRSLAFHALAKKYPLLATSGLIKPKPGFCAYAELLRTRVVGKYNLVQLSGDSVLNQVASLSVKGLLHQGFVTSEYFDTPILAIDALVAMSSGRTMDLIRESKKSDYRNRKDVQDIISGTDRIKHPILQEYGIDFLDIAVWFEDRLTEGAKDGLVGDREFFDAHYPEWLIRSYVEIGKLEPLLGSIAEARNYYRSILGDDHCSFAPDENLNSMPLLPKEDDAIPALVRFSQALDRNPPRLKSV